MNTVLFRKLSFFLACFFLGLALLLGAQWLGAICALGLGIAGWFLLDKIRWHAGQAGFILLVAAAAGGIWIGLPLWLMLLVVLFTLAFWDLDAFHYRIAGLKPDDRIKKLEKAHRDRLFLALITGGVISLAGVFIRLNLSLGWAIILGLVIVLGIRFGIRALGARFYEPIE